MSQGEAARPSPLFFSLAPCIRTMRASGRQAASELLFVFLHQFRCFTVSLLYREMTIKCSKLVKLTNNFTDNSIFVRVFNVIILVLHFYAKNL